MELSPRWSVHVRARYVRTYKEEEKKMTILDRDALLDRLGGDEEIFDEIMETYLEDIPTRLRDLRKAVDGNDVARMQHEAHAIKGASANVGAIDLQKIAAQLEGACRNGDSSQAPEMRDAIEDAFEQLRQLLTSPS